MPLYWCGGILFGFSSVPMTEEIVKEYLKGRIHWLEVHFARMDKHVPVITFESEEYKATMSVRVIDTSASLLHSEFINWLKENVKENAKANGKKR
jgi:desulfoferrodoxin (superoxide reductase-like protein)